MPPVPPDEKADTHEQGGHEGQQHAVRITFMALASRFESLPWQPYIEHVPLYDGVLYSKLQ